MIYSIELIRFTDRLGEAKVLEGINFAGPSLEVAVPEARKGPETRAAIVHALYVRARDDAGHILLTLAKSC